MNLPNTKSVLEYSLIDADLWIGSLGIDEFVRGVEHDGDLIGAVGYIEGEGAQAELFFSDLSYDYVKINAEYTT